MDDSVLINTIQSAQLDLVVTASYGKIIPKSLLSLTRLGFFNLHPSLLPEYRGAEPIFWQIAHGLTEGGISIFKMTPELDAGDLVDQLSFPIQENDNYTVVESNAIKGGIQLLRKMLTYLEANPTIPVHPQATSPRAFMPGKSLFMMKKLIGKSQQKPFIIDQSIFSSNRRLYDFIRKTGKNFRK